jgi:hypothetical protein
MRDWGGVEYHLLAYPSYMTRRFLHDSSHRMAACGLLRLHGRCEPLEHTALSYLSRSAVSLFVYYRAE